MDVIDFMKQSFLYPRLVGAIVPSSSFSAKKMVEPIQFEQANVIVELGAGTGVFTRELIRRKRNHTLLFIMEINTKFAEQLRRYYVEDPSIIVINDSAENIQQYLQKYGITKVDYVVSGLPFATLNKKLSIGILKSITTILKKGGYFMTIQYTKSQFVFLSSYFQSLQVERVYLNIPPAFIVKCKN